MTETIRHHNEENVRRHSERQRRIYYRGEGSRNKIKVISCELSAVVYKLCYNK